MLKNMFGSDLKSVQVNRYNQNFIYIFVCIYMYPYMYTRMQVHTCTHIHAYIYSSHICIYIQELYIQDT